MATATSTISAAWEPPPVITGFSGSVNEEMSYVMLMWDPSGLADADFESYRIYRREAGDMAWEILAVITNKAMTMYEDYLAGQTLVYEYKINQFKVIAGDVPLSSEDSDIVTTGLTADAWFLMMTHGDIHKSIELIVTSEDHSAVVQQEVFEPLAGTRKRIVRGLTLGNEGSLTAIFDNSIARQRKEFFETLSATAGPHILKSAFGDVWLVEFDAPGFKYTTGGHLEVSIGWVEI